MDKKDITLEDLQIGFVSIYRDLQALTERIWTLEHVPTDVKRFELLEDKIVNWNYELINLKKQIESRDSKAVGIEERIKEIEKAHQLLYGMIQKLEDSKESTSERLDKMFVEIHKIKSRAFLLETAADQKKLKKIKEQLAKPEAPKRGACVPLTDKKKPKKPTIRKSRIVQKSTTKRGKK